MSAPKQAKPHIGDVVPELCRFSPKSKLTNLRPTRGRRSKKALARKSCRKMLDDAKKLGKTFFLFL